MNARGRNVKDARMFTYKDINEEVMLGKTFINEQRLK